MLRSGLAVSPVREVVRVELKDSKRLWPETHAVGRCLKDVVFCFDEGKSKGTNGDALLRGSSFFP